MLGSIVAMLAATDHAWAISPRQLVEVVDIGNPVVSPSGRLVAYRTEQASVEKNSYDTYWYVQETAAPSLPLQVAHGGRPAREHATGLVAPVRATWSPDERWIYYLATHQGRVAVWRAATDGSGAEPVTTDPADVRTFHLGADGRKLFYSVGATRAEIRAAEILEYDRGIHIDGTVRVGAGLFRSSRFSEHPRTQRIWGQWFEADTLLATTPDRWKVVDLEHGTVVGLDAADVPLATGQSAVEAGATGDLKVIPDPSGQRMAYIRHAPGQESPQAGGSELTVQDRSSPVGERRCEAQACQGANITDVSWVPGKDSLIFTVVDRAAGRTHALYRWDLATDNVELVLHARGAARGSSQRFHDVPCGVSSRHLVCVISEPDRPPRLDLVEFEEGVHRVLFDPNARLAAEIARRTPGRLVRWKDASGRQYSGWLFESMRNDTPEAVPLFVTLYTCDGFLKGGLGDEWPLMSLAAAGIPSICINGNPGPFVMEDYYGQAVDAITGLLEKLAAQRGIPPDKVGMGGLSHGSEMTMWTVANSCLLTAASVASPSVTPSWYLFNSLRDGFRSIVEAHWGLPDPRESLQRWREVSPAFKLDSISAPVLFQLPEEEWLMAAEYAIPLARNDRADIFVFPDEPHIKFQPRHKLHAYERNLDWFRFWLLGEEDGGARKASQYKRWRDLRRSIESLSATCAVSHD